MTENVIPMVEKQADLAGTPFKVLNKEPSTFWKTGYEYYLHLKAQDKPIRHMIGRYQDIDGKKQFQIYEDGDWVSKSFWDYSEPIIDKATGKVETNRAGKPKNRPFFKEKKKYLIEFIEPKEISYWDKELKEVVERPCTKIYAVVSGNLSDKIQEQLSDPRNGDDAKYIIIYDKKRAPADQYKVRFSSE